MDYGALNVLTTPKNSTQIKKNVFAKNKEILSTPKQENYV